jgi:hypothetical protein
MQSYRAEGFGRLSLLSFLKHYLLYLEFQSSDDLRIISYCDNFSLMTRSAFRTNLPPRLASLYVRAH